MFWFRRDLRLADHPALAAAAALGPVLPVFVVDDALWKPAGANRRSFLVDSLASLRDASQGALEVLAGNPEDVLPDRAQAIGAPFVFATEDFGPYGRSRDERVAKALDDRGIELHLLDSPYAVRPGSIRSGSGTSYKVFTPFFRAWKAHGWEAPIEAPSISWHRTGSARWELPDARADSASLPDAGEEAAAEAASRFLAESVERYDETRDQPGRDATSRLSPYLKWGALHPRQLLHELGDSPGEETFRSELCWREFYAEVLYARPDSARKAYVAKMSRMETDTGPEADEKFDAWCAGQTGYPIVDAGMRQLAAEGWMHNRVRMIAASFLLKDLHIDWTRGARHFMNLLVDGDLASNQHGWQWVAGTGTDAAPYFRVFNPVSQSKKFDPEGEYLRRFIPEIAHLSDRSIHAPWTEKAGAPAGYPAPIVDHAAERREALARYDRLKSG